jgi:hypothetical protein
MPKRGVARMLWIVAAILTALVVPTSSAIPPRNIAPGQHNVFSDFSLYQAITARVQAGENYYIVAAAEQRAHHYPTKPAVTIREPTEAWLLAGLRDDSARWTAVLLLAGCAMLAMHRALAAQRLSMPSHIAGLVLTATGFASALLPTSPYLHEIWASLLLSSSIAMWRPGRYRASVALAFAACLFRELAAPVLVVMGACAVADRRWREAWVWGGATAGFAAIAALHLWLAGRQALPTDLTSPGWVRVGGWDFILLTARRNIALGVLPAPAASVATALALVGLTWADTPWGRRVAAVTFAFVGVFWFAGRPNNYYWGLLYAPLLPLGLVYAASALGADPKAGVNVHYAVLAPAAAGAPTGKKERARARFC